MLNPLRLLKKLKKPKSKGGIKYICQNCKSIEIIPYETIEYFDIVDPERLLHGPAVFTCEKCHSGHMYPEQYTAIVKGYGLYEGLDYTINVGKTKKKC